MIFTFLSVKDMDGGMWDAHNAVYSNQAVSVCDGCRLIAVLSSGVKDEMECRLSPVQCHNSFCG